jgi:hypothetical protein
VCRTEQTKLLKISTILILTFWFSNLKKYNGFIDGYSENIEQKMPIIEFV